MDENPETEKPDMGIGDVLNQLHKFLFAISKSHPESAKNPIAFCSHVTDYVKLLEENSGRIFSDEPEPEKALMKLADFASKSEYFDRVEVKRIAEGKFEFFIHGCSFAKNNKTHSHLISGKDSCAMAMIASSIIKHSHSGYEVNLHPTEFMGFDSKSIIEFRKI